MRWQIIVRHNSGCRHSSREELKFLCVDLSVKWIIHWVETTLRHRRCKSLRWGTWGACIPQWLTPKEFSVTLNRILRLVTPLRPLIPTRREHSFEIFVNFDSFMTRGFYFRQIMMKKYLVSLNRNVKSSLIIETALFFVRPSSVRQICLQSASPHPHNSLATAETLHAFFFRVRSALANDNRFLWSVAPRNAERLMGVSLIRKSLTFQTRHTKNSLLRTITSRYKLRSRVAQKKIRFTTNATLCQSSNGSLAYSSIERFFGNRE